MFIVFNIIIVLGCLAAIANLVITFFLVSFLVKSRDKMKEFFSDLVQMISGFEPPEAVAVESVPARPKTWDEKFEQELDERERRMRSGSGLDDLPPPKATYNEPPAANPEAQEGLNLRANKGNMRAS